MQRARPVKGQVRTIASVDRIMFPICNDVGEVIAL